MKNGPTIGLLLLGLLLTVGSLIRVVVSGISYADEHKQETDLTSTTPTSSTKKILYWKDPDGLNLYSSEPKKMPDGRDYIAVFEDEEKEMEGKNTTSVKEIASNRKILYYRNPMGLADTSPIPKKDWMGMDYIPVYEGDEQNSSRIKISLDKVQRTGVRSVTVEKKHLERVIRAPGVAKPDERSLYTATLRTDGFIEKLYVNETGRHIEVGEPMFRVYSPQMVAVQVDYRIANAPDRSIDERGAEQRLKNLGMPETVLEELRRTRTPIISFDWPSPVSGIVTRKNVVEGQMVKAGEEIFRIVDLSTIWVIADVPEQDVDLIKVGQEALLKFRAFPDEVFKGQVTFILHELDMVTRTGKVRIEVKNLDNRIRHEMFADVEIDVGKDRPESLSIPQSALIDSGNRQVVILDKGDGTFEPQNIVIGERGNNWVSIKEGLSEGDRVVESGNFLIDAESNLNSALSSFNKSSKQKSAIDHTGRTP
ncbi:MAG: efflux RND transporter periplasmic adaptor subunit [Hyphomicrobium sp.]